MDESDSYPIPERNPVTHQRHKRDVRWQITAPLAAGILFVLTMFVLAASAEANDASQFADIALICLTIPTLFATLIIFIVLAALIYGVVRMIFGLPFFARRVQIWFELFGSKIVQVGEAAVEPFMRVHSFTASARALGRKLRRK